VIVSLAAEFPSVMFNVPVAVEASIVASADPVKVNVWLLEPVTLSVLNEVEVIVPKAIVTAAVLSVTDSQIVKVSSFAIVTAVKVGVVPSKTNRLIASLVVLSTKRVTAGVPIAAVAPKIIVFKLD